MLPFAVPYPPEQANGFWGPPTLTIDWCEENYVVLPFVAEALNTATNAVFIALAGYAIVHAVQHKMEKRFVFASLGFMLVGVGLWLFHMTLHYEYQLLDELPMIYATCIPFWSVFSEKRSTRGLIWVGIGIFTAANLLTAIYLYIKDPTIHQTAYGILNACIIFKLYTLANRHVHDPDARKGLNRALARGVLTFLFGYFLWNLDIHLCDHFRAIRRSWGMPYGFLLEGHGWWHIFTGTGVFFYISYQEYLRCWLTGTHRFYRFHWVLGLPQVVLVDEQGLQEFRQRAQNRL